MGPHTDKQKSGNLTKPKSIKELPSYLLKTVKGFLSRLFYIVSLVWETSPVI